MKRRIIYDGTVGCEKDCITLKEILVRAIKKEKEIKVKATVEEKENKK